jgi:hypothetical protein
MVYKRKKMVEREMAVKIVEDTFRKMQEPASNVAVSRSHIESGHSVKSKKKSDDSGELNVKVRCPCGNSKPNDSMIKCVDPQCNIRQHVGCVVIPENEKSANSISPDLPSRFYCEMCRISRADPFWVTINNLLLPVLIGPSTIAADRSYTVQYTTKSFQLSRANREMLQKAEYDIQVWCILLNDKVPFRMQWPLHSDMQVNGIWLIKYSESYFLIGFWCKLFIESKNLVKGHLFVSSELYSSHFVQRRMECRIRHLTLSQILRL